MYTYPPPQNLAYPARVLSGEGPLSRSDPSLGQSESWPDRGAPGWSTRLVTTVERREAQRPTSLGARGWRYQLREVGTLLPPPRVPRKHSGASRRSTPSQCREGPANLGRMASRECGSVAVRNVHRNVRT